MKTFWRDGKNKQVVLVVPAFNSSTWEADIVGSLLDGSQPGQQKLVTGQIPKLHRENQNKEKSKNKQTKTNHPQTTRKKTRSAWHVVLLYTTHRSHQASELYSNFILNFWCPEQQNQILL